MLLLISFFTLYSLLKNSSINVIRVCAFLFLAVITSGCDDIKLPIEADDFGFPKVSIEAKGKNVTGEQENELADWEFSGYRYNGSLAVIMVYNDLGNGTTVWTSWFGNGESILTQDMRSGQYCCIGGSVNGDGDCDKPKYCKKFDDKYEDISNAPCIFSQGQGLYMLLTKPSNTGVTDPNTYKNVNRAPSSAGFFTIGLWQYTGMYQNNQLANGYIAGFIDPTPATAGTAVVYSKESNNIDNNELNATTTYTNISIPADNVNGDAYFKILDRYYDDNSGAYFISLKNGFNTTVTPPIASAINIVMTNLNNASEAIFKRVITNGNYRSILRATLSLYIIIYGIMFIGGMVSISQKDMIKMMIKLIIVIQLLTTKTSWAVFNGYFFQFFTGGLTEIIGIITSTISGSYGGGEGGSGLTFFDAMLNLLFSYETTMKILALVLSVPTGIVVAAMIYVAFGMFILALAKAVMLYLLAYIAISLFIATAPFFIALMLFKPTKAIFDSWLNQLVSYFFQPILVFAALAMIAQYIISQMHKLLGFRVCYDTWIKIGDMVILKMWQICPFNKASHILTTIPVPGYGYWDLNNPDNFCSPYLCSARRYIDLPFLVPADPSGSPVYDQSFIDAFAAPATLLNLPMLYNGLMLMLMSFLLFLFNDTIPALAKGIAGTATGAGDGSSGLSRTAGSAVQNVIGAAKGVVNSAKGFAAKRFNKMAGRSALGRKFLEFDKYKKEMGSKLFAEPKNKNKTLTAMSKAVSGVGNAANFLFRVAVPPGSLMNTMEREKAERDGTLANSKYADKIKAAIYKKTGLDKIVEGAEAFDKDVSRFRAGVVDTIGRAFDFRKAGQTDRAEDIALLRKAGLLDKKFEKYGLLDKEGDTDKEKEAKKARRREIENKLSSMELRTLKLSANKEQIAKMDALKINLEKVRAQEKLGRQQNFDNAINVAGKTISNAANYAAANAISASNYASAGARFIGKKGKDFAEAAPVYASYGARSASDFVHKAPERMYTGFKTGIVMSYKGTKTVISGTYSAGKAGVVMTYNAPSTAYKTAADISFSTQVVGGVIKQGALDTATSISNAPGKAIKSLNDAGSKLSKAVNQKVDNVVFSTKVASARVTQGALDTATSISNAPGKAMRALDKAASDAGKAVNQKVDNVVFSAKVASARVTQGALDTATSISNAPGKAMRAVDKAASDAGKAVQRKVDDVAFSAQVASARVTQGALDTATSISNAPGKAMRALDKAASDAGKAIQRKVDDVAFSAQVASARVTQGALDTATTISNAPGKAMRAVDKAASDAGKAIQRKVDDVAFSAQVVSARVTQGALDTATTISNAPGKAMRAVDKAVSDVGTSIQTSMDNTGKSIKKAASDVAFSAQVASARVTQGALDTATSISNAPGKAMRAVDKAVSDVGTSIQTSMDNTGKSIKKAASDVAFSAQVASARVTQGALDTATSISNAPGKAMRAVDKTVSDVGTSIQTSMDNTGKSIKKAASDVAFSAQVASARVTQGALDTATSISNAPGKAMRAVDKAVSDVGTSIQTSMDNTGKSIKKAASDVAFSAQVTSARVTQGALDTATSISNAPGKAQRELNKAGKVAKRTIDDASFKAQVAVGMAKEGLSDIASSAYHAPGKLGKAIKESDTYKAVSADLSDAYKTISADLSDAKETLSKDYQEVSSTLDRDIGKPIKKALLSKKKKNDENE